MEAVTEDSATDDEEQKPLDSIKVSTCHLEQFLSENKEKKRRK
jgi:hypothetical protein